MPVFLWKLILLGTGAKAKHNLFNFGFTKIQYCNVQVNLSAETASCLFVCGSL